MARKNHRMVIAWVFLVCCGVVGQGAAEPVPGAGPFNVTIFHTNDTHSHFPARPATWRDDGKMVGGVVALGWQLTQQRQTSPADILVDAGDFMTGNPVCNLEQDGVPGYAIARMMTLLGYDAGVVGNHEFDIGLDALDRLLPLFGYPVMAMDILDTAGNPRFAPGPLVLERGGLRIGIMAVSCGGMEELVTPSRFRGLRMGDQETLIRRQLVDLDPVTDLVVLLSHNGIDDDRALAAALEGSGVDVIVGGHSHTRLREPELVGGILIVQAGSKMTNLGRLDLEVVDDEVRTYRGQLVDLWAEGTRVGPELTAAVDGFAAQVQEEFGRTIGTLAVDMKPGRGETLLGNWLADVLRARAGSEVALINSGGIRKALLAGPLTALDIHEILPFANELVTMEISGRQLARIVQRNADSDIRRDHGILQVSGLRYAYRAAADGSSAVVEEIEVGGKPLATDAVYTVALPDYVAAMSHVYLDIEVPPLTDLGQTLAAVVIQAVEISGTVTAAREGRIRRLNPVPQEEY